MASDETMNFQSSLPDEEVDDDHDHHQPQNLSRLSVCTSSTLCDVDDEQDQDQDHVDNIDNVENVMSMYVSQLSIENFDADGEISDTKEDITPKMLTLSSDSENEGVFGCYSLPITPPRRRNKNNHVGYASENEAMMMKTKNNDPMRNRSRRVQKRRGYEKWGVDKNNSFESSKKKEEEHVIQGLSGESDQSVGVMVITRPKGGRRSLCMDLEEVKACRDLGFELEHEKMLSFSNSALDTSSGGNSPIANWRISSPGDDPRDVKARLKVWAQAVALASTSKYGT